MFSRRSRAISCSASTTRLIAAHTFPGAATAAPAIATSFPPRCEQQYTSEQLATLVNNPFQGLFSGPGAIFNEPESRYGDAQLPLLNLLRPYPQFDGAFQGLPKLSASSWYNAMQVVFQKREGKYLNFEGNYTWSKNMDDSSTGFNAFVGTLE